MQVLYFLSALFYELLHLYVYENDSMALKSMPFTDKHAFFYNNGKNIVRSSYMP